MSLIVLFTATVSCNAQAETSVEFWRQELARAPLSDIALQLFKSSAPRWPGIESSYSLERLAGRERSTALQWQELASQLLSKMAAEYSSENSPDSLHLEAEVKLFADISSQMRRAGGYDNLVLADCAERLAIFKVTGWLVFHSDELSEVEKLMLMLQAPPLNIRQLLIELKLQDRQMAAQGNTFEKIQENTNLFECFGIFGADYYEALSPTKCNSETLLKEPSVLVLVSRMASTKSLVRVNISYASCQTPATKG